MLHLVPMTDAYFAEYRSRLIAEYAQEHIKGGRWSPEEALEESTKDIDELLPQGVATPEQELYTLMADGEQVGILWFGIRAIGKGPVAFIYDIEISAEHRRKGYAAQALQLLEARVAELGLSAIRLHVFGDNAGAIRLYEQLGYRPTNIQMEKIIDPAPPISPATDDGQSRS